ncbi:arrestin domain-containing protein 3 [Nematostella vectensis]|uniref:arrestin domain-containing protein 3 n=1 Tax=Nematostella vectensis TaxID=45351 RepID=UPI0020771943|nr:arrestin domain-containing protein 3 [Nematostella vectensis]
MGKGVTFEIVLNRKNRIYHPGEVVSGECVVYSKESLKFRSVHVEFHGEARTNWDEMENYTTTHKNEEVYFNKKTSLLANGDKKGAVSVLSAGRHALEFSFKIPPFSLPSSFESTHGHVRYYLRARIRRPWRFDEVTKLQVHVINLIDVNSSRLLMPVFGEAQKALNCLCNGTAAPLHALVYTDRTAYCPGERLTLTTEIRNLPLREPYETCVYLVQSITYKSSCGRTRSVNKQVKVLQRSSMSLELDEFEVSDVVPTMRNCGIVSICYHLKVIVAVAHGHGSGVNLEVELPITIATIPLGKSCGLINKLAPYSQLTQEPKFTMKTFVGIKHVLATGSPGYPLPAVAT